MADVVVDTTDLNVNQLRERLADLFSGDDASAMQILVLSFGYKHGVPLDVDNVLRRAVPAQPSLGGSRCGPSRAWTNPCGATSWASRRPRSSWTGPGTC